MGLFKNTPRKAKEPAEETVKDMLTQDEVVAQLGVTRKTLWLWRKSGSLPFVEFPKGQIKYRKADIEKILKEGL